MNSDVLYSSNSRRKAAQYCCLFDHHCSLQNSAESQQLTCTLRCVMAQRISGVASLTTLQGSRRMFSLHACRYTRDVSSHLQRGTNLIWTGLGLKPVHRGEVSATNLLKHATAYCFMIIGV
jgi:hypothetical protein